MKETSMKTPVCVLVALALASPALGVTFVVNDTADVHDGNPGNGVCQTASPGICTLRAAMDEANATSGATIQLPAGTFTLTLGPLPVQTPTTIVGAGAGVSIVSGNNLS